MCKLAASARGSKNLHGSYLGERFPFFQGMFNFAKEQENWERHCYDIVSQGLWMGKETYVFRGKMTGESKEILQYINGENTNPAPLGELRFLGALLYVLS